MKYCTTTQLGFLVGLHAVLSPAKVKEVIDELNDLDTEKTDQIFYEAFHNKKKSHIITKLLVEYDTLSNKRKAWLEYRQARQITKSTPLLRVVK